MLLYLILWTIAGIIGESLVGLFYGFKVAKIEDEYELDENSTDYVYKTACLATCLKVTPLAKPALMLMANGSKILWIIIGVFNNFWNFAIWPVFIPVLMYNLDSGIEELYKCIDYVKEGS